MKKDLIKLIDSRKEIEKMFHPFDGGKGTSFERISDVPEFQNWLQEIKLELQGIYDRTHDTFVWETINLCGKRLDGFTEKKYFIELVGKLQAIRKNIDKYYPDEEKESGLSHSQGGASSMKKKPLIFISHSSKNKDQVAKIADLLRSINLSPRRDIFCSSLPGYGIPNGANIFDFLRERFLNYDLHIIFVHSPEYYESPVSLNEMGAAWVLRANATSLLLPGFDFSGMKGVIGSDCIAIKLDGKVGTVYIKELSAPAGYKVDKTVYSLKVEAGKTATLPYYLGVTSFPCVMCSYRMRTGHRVPSLKSVSMI